MEKYLKLVLTLLSIGAALFAAAVIAAVVYRLVNRRNAEHVLICRRNSGIVSDGISFIYELLKTSFPESRILSRTVLSMKNAGGKVSECKNDIILVGNGGVFIIQVYGQSGRVDNTSDDGIWTISGADGGVSIRNPFEDGKRKVKLVERILRRERIYGAPIYFLVVFSGKKVTFCEKREKLFKPEQLMSALEVMNRRSALGRLDMTSAVTALKKYVRRGSDGREARVNTADQLRKKY